MNLYYCYDAYCGWCFGFSKVINKVAKIYEHQLHTEVLSGGMVLPLKPTHIGVTANYILENYGRVEALTGVKFGDDYLWHLKNYAESDWFPNSLMPSVALCIFKEIYPSLQVQFASELQQALFYDGRDLTDKEAYTHLLEKYNIPAAIFHQKLQDEVYITKAQQEFQLCKQLKATGYPYLLLQHSNGKFYVISQGYSQLEDVVKRIDDCLNLV